METPGERDYKRVLGGLLVQERDVDVDDRQLMTVVAGSVSEEQWGDLLFAWRVCKHVSSNAIVLAKGLQTIGIGAGQMSRVDAVRIAFEKARELGHDPAGAVLASDAFFPFADGPKLALDAGIAALIQPGGSKRDDEVIEAVKAAGAAMILTGPPPLPALSSGEVSHGDECSPTAGFAASLPLTGTALCRAGVFLPQRLQPAIDTRTELPMTTTIELAHRNQDESRGEPSSGTAASAFPLEVFDVRNESGFAFPVDAKCRRWTPSTDPYAYGPPVLDDDLQALLTVATAEAPAYPASCWTRTALEVETLAARRARTPARSGGRGAGTASGAREATRVDGPTPLAEFVRSGQRAALRRPAEPDHAMRPSSRGPQTGWPAHDLIRTTLSCGEAACGRRASRRASEQRRLDRYARSSSGRTARRRSAAASPRSAHAPAAARTLRLARLQGRAEGAAPRRRPCVGELYRDDYGTRHWLGPCMKERASSVVLTQARRGAGRRGHKLSRTADRPRTRVAFGACVLRSLRAS